MKVSILSLIALALLPPLFAGSGALDETRAQCAPLRDAVAKNDAAQIRALSEPLLNAADDAVWQYALFARARVANAADLPLFAAQAKRDKKAALRAAIFVQDPAVSARLYDLARTAEDDGDKAFYYELLSQQPDAGAYFEPLYAAAFEKGERAALRWYGACADTTNFDFVYARMTDPALPEDTARALLPVFLRLCAESPSGCARFVDAYPTFGDALKKRTMLALSADSGARALALFTETCAGKTDALRLLSKWRNSNAFSYLRDLAKKDPAMQPFARETALGLCGALVRFDDPKDFDALAEIAAFQPERKRDFLKSKLFLATKIRAI